VTVPVRRLGMQLFARELPKTVHTPAQGAADRVTSGAGSRHGRAGSFGARNPCPALAHGAFGEVTNPYSRDGQVDE
jgi:hypothetical protein